jgi:hypothetical protein
VFFHTLIFFPRNSGVLLNSLSQSTVTPRSSYKLCTVNLQLSRQRRVPFSRSSLWPLQSHNKQHIIWPVPLICAVVSSSSYASWVTYKSYNQTIIWILQQACTTPSGFTCLHPRFQLFSLLPPPSNHKPTCHPPLSYLERGTHQLIVLCQP